MSLDEAEFNDAPSPEEPRAIPRLDGYQLLRLLGRGGLGEVYLGLRDDGRKLAVKLLAPEFAHSPDVVSGVLLDLPIVAKLRHDHILPLVEFGQRNGQVFLASELREGDNLRDFRVRSGGTVPWPVAEAILAMTLKGLEAAHSRQVVHGGLKPTNVLMSADGNLKLGDFSSGRVLDRDQVPRIALPYLSPEQARLEMADARSDLFSASVLVCELLTGTTPFLGSDPRETLDRLANADSPALLEANATIPAYLEGILLTLLSRDPAHRYPSAVDALAELGRHSPNSVERAVDMVRPVYGNPNAWRSAWTTAQARRHFRSGEQLLQQTPPQKYRAILELIRASLLAPAVTGAEEKLRDLSPERSLLEPAQSPRLTSLEDLCRAQPENTTALINLARLCEAEFDVLRASALLRRAALLNPDDETALIQLRHMLGDEADQALGPALSRRRKSIAIAEPEPSPPAQPMSREERRQLLDTAPLIYRVPTPKGRSPLADRLPAIVLVVVVLGGSVWAVRGIGRFIESSQVETIRSTDALRTSGEVGTPAIDPVLSAKVSGDRARAESEFGEAMVVVAADDAARAEKALLTYRQRHPAGPHALDLQFFLGRIYVRQARHDLAAPELKDFVAHGAGDPRMEEARWLLIQALAGTNAGDLALHECNMFLTRYPDSKFAPQLLLLTADLELRAGDATAARGRYRALLDRKGLTEDESRLATEGLAKLPQ